MDNVPNLVYDDIYIVAFMPTTAVARLPVSGVTTNAVTPIPEGTYAAKGRGRPALGPRPFGVVGTQFYANQ